MSKHQPNNTHKTALIIIAVLMLLSIISQVFRWVNDDGVTYEYRIGKPPQTAIGSDGSIWILERIENSNEFEWRLFVWSYPEPE